MIGELANHVWQSTAFAAVAWLMTMAFRGNRAQVRYWIWLSASVKFLLPFSLLVGAGNRLEWAPALGAMPATALMARSMAPVGQPLPGAWPFMPALPVARDWAAFAIFGVWMCGFAAVALLRFRGWRRIRAAVRASTPFGYVQTVEVRSSAALLEPGVVGLFRPTLLLPRGIAERLKPPQLNAILAHELCHVRRCDNVTSAIHMIVEALFWFDPVVWWIGARLVEERERACDEAVLRLGTQPYDYAEGILTVCRSYLESPVSCVSGVTGSNLKKRIQDILMGRIARDLSFAKKLMLATAAIIVVGLPVLLGTAGAAAPEFEAVSIKPCTAFHRSENRSLPPGTFDSGCTTLERLIQQAYGLFANGRTNRGSSLTVEGGPAWIKSDLYRIDAHTSARKSRAQMNGPMLQAVLENRFKLKFHRETRNVPIYELTVATDGPELHSFRGSCTPREFDKPSDTDCGKVRGYGNVLHMKAMTIADLCAGLSVLLDLPVVDRTGRTGRFNMDLDLSAEDHALVNRPRSLPALRDPTAPEPPPVDFPPLKSALNKIGLNLEPGNGPGEFLVIDHVERPSGS